MEMKLYNSKYKYHYLQWQLHIICSNQLSMLLHMVLHAYEEES